MMGDRASVIFAAPEEARKVATFATSSSVPVRARGVMLAAYSMKLFSASRLAAAFSCAGDGITPGLIALTRTGNLGQCCSGSLCQCFQKPSLFPSPIAIP